MISYNDSPRWNNEDDDDTYECLDFKKYDQFNSNANIIILVFVTLIFLGGMISTTMRAQIFRNITSSLLSSSKYLFTRSAFICLVLSIMWFFVISYLCVVSDLCNLLLVGHIRAALGPCQ